VWLEQVADVADGAAERVKSSCFSLAQMRFDLCEDLLDWVQIGRISRQEQKLGAVLLQVLGGLLAPMYSQIVEHPHIALSQRRRELRLDVNVKR
jgi:hypothetical protein